jgi:hypothetical protein
MAEIGRSFHPIYIDAPSYSARSGGVRALYLLCHHLNRLGYKAYIIESSSINATPALQTPSLDIATVKRHKIEGCEPIVVYPEIIAGNPRKAKIVVRYLLNTPERLPRVLKTYRDSDYFMHYTEEHAIPGTKSFDMFIPLVNHNIYHPPHSGIQREGFVLYANRAKIDSGVLPSWLLPLTIVSMDTPRSHGELATLYRQSRAMVCFERGTAMLEALHCGCPIICIEGALLRKGAYQSLFEGAGLVWGWHEERLPQATTEIAKFRTLYAALEQNTGWRVNSAFQEIAADFDRRRTTSKRFAHTIFGFAKSRL